MKVEIGKIRVAGRIRKQPTKIDELAADIRQNGLLNPITVMPVGGEHQLLAGLRRLQAARLLGWTEIDVNEVSPKDAEAALRIEYSENVQRENFTYSEKMDFARLIKEIEQAKARERSAEGQTTGGTTAGRGRPKDDSYEIRGSHSYEGKKRPPQVRDIVGEKIGMSGPTYQRAAYVAEHAPPEVIEQIDNGEKTITGAYWELRAAEKAPAPPPAPSAATPPAPTPEPPVIKPPVIAPKPPVPNPKKAPPPEPVREPMPPPETPLERAIRAERELDAMKYRQHNEIYHRDSKIENLKMRNEALQNRVAELEAALEAANARIRELEQEAGHA